MTGEEPVPQVTAGCVAPFAYVGRLFGLRTWHCTKCPAIYTRDRPRPHPPRH